MAGTLTLLLGGASTHNGTKGHPTGPTTPARSRPTGSELAELLRGYRERAGWTQQQLSQRSYVSVRTIRNIESGRIESPRATSLDALADALELAPPERHRLGAPKGRDPRRDGYLPSRTPRSIGRAHGAGEVARLLEQRITRMVTLVGEPGTARSDLALATAHELAGSVTVWWVPVTLNSNGDRLLRTIGKTTGCPAASVTQLATHLGPERGLLVLHNETPFEDDQVGLVIDLVVQSPQLAVLAVSPLPMNVPGEHVWRVVSG